MRQVPEKAKSEFERAYELAYGVNRPKTIPWKEIFALWLTSAQQGYIRAMFYTAVCYDLGHGTRKNLRLAFDWNLKAAKLKHPDAQYNIGFFYSKSEVVEKDYRKMLYWYSKAAKAGIIDAQRDLRYAINTGMV